jgi:hypothetical protein
VIELHGPGMDLSLIRVRCNRPETCPFDFDGPIAIPNSDEITLMRQATQDSPEIERTRIRKRVALKRLSTRSKRWFMSHTVSTEMIMS